MASRDLRVTLIGEDKTGDAFGSAGKGADGMGAKFAAIGKVAAVGLAGAVGAFAVFGKSGVDAYARIEDATGAAGVQFGAASTEVVKFAETASKSFGLSTGAALDAANTFGTIGKAAGLSGGPLGDFSTNLTGLAGDLASFKGTSTEQAVEAVGAALRGETEPMRAYGVLLDQASIDAEALALGLVKPVVASEKVASAQAKVRSATEGLSKAISENGKGSTEAQTASAALGSAQAALGKATQGTVEDLTMEQKVMATQSLIMKQTADAQGDFARTSDSTANTAKRLAAETENASAKLGKQLAPAVTAAREAFLSLIKGASGFVDMIGPAVASAQVAVAGFFDAVKNSEALKTAFGAIASAATAVGSAVMSTVTFFRQHETAARALGVVVAAVAAAVAAAWVAQAAVSVANAARSVAAWVATATASTTSSTIQSRSTAQIVVGWIAASAAATFNAAKVVAGWILTGLSAVASAAVTVAQVAIQVTAWTVLATAGAAVNAARVVAGWLITSAGAIAARAVMVAQVAVQVGAWVLLGVQSMLAAARVAAAWLIAMGPIGLVIIAVVGLVALIVKNWDTIKSKTEQLWNAVKSATAATWDWIKGAVGQAISFVTGIFMNFTGPGLIIKHWDTIKRTFTEGVAAVTGFMRELPGKIVSAVGNLGSLLANAGGELVEGLIRGISDKIGALKQKMADLANTIKGFLPGSPVKEGPLTSWNNGAAGKRLMGMLASGIDDGSGMVARAMTQATDLADLAGMNVGGSAFVNRRLTATAPGVAGYSSGSQATGGSVELGPNTIAALVRGFHGGVGAALDDVALGASVGLNN